MELKRDLEKNQRLTFLIWRMIVSPRVRSTGGNVSKTCRYSRPVPTVFTGFCWELRYATWNTLLVQKEFQQFVLTGAWHLPCFLLGLMSPIQLFPSSHLAALRNAHFPQSNEFPKDKFKTIFFFLVEWNKIVDASVYESKMGCKLQYMLIFKSKDNLSVSLPVTNNLQAVSKSYNMELFNWPFRFQTDVYTSVIHNGSLFGKLANY